MAGKVYQNLWWKIMDNIFFLCIFKEKHFKKLFNTPMYALNAKEIHLNNALQNISINERFGITEIKRVWQSV
jgi:hypothetical protein